MSCQSFRLGQYKLIAILPTKHTNIYTNIAVCRSGCGVNSISCSQCKLWMHKKCSVCLRCQALARPIDSRAFTEVDTDCNMLDVEATFCYLKDTLDAGGGCATAIATRCCVAWGKFRKLLPVLTSHTTVDRHPVVITRQPVLLSAAGLVYRGPVLYFTAAGVLLADWTGGRSYILPRPVFCWLIGPGAGTNFSRSSPCNSHQLTFNMLYGL